MGAGRLESRQIWFGLPDVAIFTTLGHTGRLHHDKNEHSIGSWLLFTIQRRGQ